MNALTKAFVVVVTILAVVLVALVIPFAARVPNYAQQFEQMKQARDAQVATATQAAAEVRSAMAAKGSELETALASLSSLTAELDRANSDKKALETKLAQAEVTVARNSAAMEIAARINETNGKQINQQSDLIKDQLALIGDLQAQRGDLSQSLIQARSDIRRLSDNYLRIQEENKAISQQLLESQANLKKAMDKLAGYDVDPSEVFTSVVPPDGQTIRGSVTKIDQVTEGLTFVQVNIGTRDLVKEGMEFTVYRGDEFVGKIQIASVDTAQSVGQLTLGSGIKEGDAVRAGGR